MKYFFTAKTIPFFCPFLFSLRSRKDVVYYQGVDGMVSKKIEFYEIKIQPDDVLDDCCFPW
jgi:polysaccharide export outer membrane protein